MNVSIFRSAQLVFLSLLPLPPTRSQPEAVGMSRTWLPRPPRGSGQHPASGTSRQHLLGGRCPAQGSLGGRGAEQSCGPLAARGGGLVRRSSGCLPCWLGGGGWEAQIQGGLLQALVVRTLWQSPAGQTPEQLCAY